MTKTRALFALPLAALLSIAAAAPARAQAATACTRPEAGVCECPDGKHDGYDSLLVVNPGVDPGGTGTTCVG